jgi:hypothetical protein
VGPTPASERGRRRGFVIGELLLAVLLLAVAVSSLAALMYSVSKRENAPERVECVTKSGAKCATHVASGTSKLFRSGTCANRSARECKDTLVQALDETVLRSRTDSASLALLPKPRKTRQAPRPDRGFIR